MNTSLRLLLCTAMTLCLACSPPYRRQADLGSIYLQSPVWSRLDVDVYKFERQPPDSSYGFIPENHVKAAYRNGSDTLAGPQMEHYYLAHLTCRCGGGIDYYRIGSCCPVPSIHAVSGGSVLLDMYKLRCRNCRKTSTIYINMYDSDSAVYAPCGYRLKLVE